MQFDEESGEGDTLAVERERDLALSAQARPTVDEIDHALTKIDVGTYGICEVSGQPDPEGAPARPSRGPASGSSTRSAGSADAERASADDARRPPTSCGRHARARASALVLAVAAVVVVARPAHQVVGGQRASTTATTIDLVWTLRFHLAFNSGHGVQPGPGGSGR